MRQFVFFLLASGLFWTGCIGNDSLGSSAAAQRNIENLARISLGMTNQQVFQIMRHPYKSESFEVEGDRFEVWFYITRLMIMDQSEPAHTNLTPLTFRNGVLEGKGYNYYNKVMNIEAEAESETTSPPIKEDKDLEKALTPPPGSKPAKPTKPVTPPPSAPQPAPKKDQTKPKQAPATNQKPNSQQQPQSSEPKSTSSSSIREPTPGQQPATPAQPHATQPPAPVQPGSQPAPSKSSSQGNLTMSKSSSSPPPEEQTAPVSQKKTPEKKGEKQTESKVPLTKEDEKMLEEEREEDFNFW